MNARSTPLLLILAACRAAPAPVVAEVDPARGARASEHLSAAGQHAARAAKYAQLADALRNQPQRRYDDPRTGLWVRAMDEERQADAHVAAAAALEAEARDRCAGFSPEDAQVSVLQRLAQGGEARPDGVIVYLPVSAGPADRLVGALRCHQAWMRLGQAAGDQCPLEITGVDLVAYGDDTGVSVELVVADPALVPELQRRARVVVETGQHRR